MQRKIQQTFQFAIHGRSSCILRWYWCRWKWLLCLWFLSQYWWTWVAWHWITAVTCSTCKLFRCSCGCIYWSCQYGTIMAQENGPRSWCWHHVPTFAPYKSWRGVSSVDYCLYQDRPKCLNRCNCTYFRVRNQMRRACLRFLRSDEDGMAWTFSS